MLWTSYSEPWDPNSIAPFASTLYMSHLLSRSFVAAILSSLCVTSAKQQTWCRRHEMMNNCTYYACVPQPVNCVLLHTSHRDYCQSECFDLKWPIMSGMLKQYSTVTDANDFRQWLVINGIEECHCHYHSPVKQNMQWQHTLSKICNYHRKN